MAMIQGIDGSVLLNALRAGREDRWTDNKRAAEQEAMRVKTERDRRFNGVLGRLPQGGGVSGYASPSPTANVAPAGSAFDSAFSPSAMGDIASGGNPPIDAPITPAAPQAAPQPVSQQDIMRQLVIIDPERASHMIDAFKTMDESNIKNAQAKNDIMGAAAHYVEQGQTAEEQFARFEHAVPQLMAMGWTQQEIQGAEAQLRNPDPNARMRALKGYQAVAIDTDKMLDNELAQRQFEEGKVVPVAPQGSLVRMKPGQAPEYIVGGPGNPPSGGGTSGPSGIPQAAVDHLRKNPALKADFDAKYGAGAADSALGGGQEQFTQEQYRGMVSSLGQAGADAYLQRHGLTVQGR